MRKCLIFLLTVFCSQFSVAQDIPVSPVVPGDVVLSINEPVDEIKLNSIHIMEAGKDGTFLNFKKSMIPPANVAAVSPYTTSFLKDGLALAGAVGVTLLGYTLIENKDNLTPAELAAKTKDKLPFFDSWQCGILFTAG